MKSLMLMLLFLPALANGSVLFLNSDMLSAFDAALSDFKKSHLKGYSSFIQEHNGLIEVSFIEHSFDNTEGSLLHMGEMFYMRLSEVQIKSSGKRSLLPNDFTL